MRDPNQLAKKRATQRRWKIKSLYGINEQEYDRMYEEQNGLCYICKSQDGREYRLAVDHCHETGKVRRLLCGACNLLIGNARERIEVLESAIEYLREQGVK